MARRTLKCKMCSIFLQKSERTNGFCKTCEKNKKVKSEEEIKASGEPTCKPPLDMKPISLKNIPIEKFPDKESENECWKEDSKLPEGWKISSELGDNLFVLLSREGNIFQTLESAHEFMKNTVGYDDHDILDVEELCLSMVSDYVKLINLAPQSINNVKEKKTILSRGAMFTCEKCGQSFRKKDTLEAHKKVHSGFKPYACELCLKSYKSNEQLQSHLKNHKEEVLKLYTCQVCSKILYYLSEMLKHMKNNHPDFYPYKCTICDEDFSRSEVLRLHKKSHTKLEVPRCDVCNKSFQRNFSLKRHMAMFHSSG